jgi:hypothetical protein
MQTLKIAKEHQENTISCYWQMLRMIESRAHCSDGVVDRHFVEAFYRHWNTMTGDDKVPIWVEQEQEARKKILEALTKKRPFTITTHGVWHDANLLPLSDGDTRRILDRMHLEEGLIRKDNRGTLNSYWALPESHDPTHPNGPYDDRHRAQEAEPSSK